MTPESLMFEAAVALERCNIMYMLVGSIASNYHGLPRLTQDADFLIQVERFPAALLAGLLNENFVMDPQSSLETFTMGTYYTLRHRHSDFVIDFFLLKNDPHDQVSFSRRLQISIEGRTVFVPTPEDVIITKLRWSQVGRRNKDISDARNVIAVQAKTLDLAYIRQWCDVHNTLELFESQLQSIPKEL